MEEEFRKHLGSRAIISFGSKDDLADGRVVRIETATWFWGPVRFAVCPLSEYGLCSFCQSRIGILGRPICA